MSVNMNQQSLVTRQIWNMYARQRRSVEEIQNDYVILQQKLHDILEDVLPDWEIRLVGSSMNGLSTYSSDLDLCLIDDYSDLSSWQIIQYLVCGLKRYGIDNRPLYVPEIPLVRFCDDTTGRQVDLGINSRNSIRNTHLIQCYTKYDWRVKPLLTIIKLWAEGQDINDSTKQGISNYSLVLKAIHYLQVKCRPPILPCLQALKPNFAQYIGSLDQCLPAFSRGQPETDLETLFCGFLRYYAYEFDYGSQAISVRQGRTIAKSSSKKFLDPRPSDEIYYKICIEEPFSLTNTAKAVHGEQAFNKIIIAFRTSYEALKQRPDLNEVIN